MPSVDWNRNFWSAYDWPADGEEWSSEWGGAKSQWLTMILPRISQCIPAARIVEIAPGRGRWTHFLLALCKSYAGYDLCPNDLDLCRQRFQQTPLKVPAEFFETDGRSLSHEAAASVDFIFSFDSLVHAERDEVDGYLAECMRVLVPGGYAFLHHSNLAALDDEIKKIGLKNHSRGMTVSAETVRERCDELGLLVLVQETVSWKQVYLMDCFSLIAKAPLAAAEATVIFSNPDFWDDISRVGKNTRPYPSI